MPIYLKKKDGTREEVQNIISNTYGCLNCGKPISYEVTKSKFCLECKLKYPEQIRKYRSKKRKILENVNGVENG